MVRITALFVLVLLGAGACSASSENGIARESSGGSGSGGAMSGGASGDGAGGGTGATPGHALDEVDKSLVDWHLGARMQEPPDTSSCLDELTVLGVRYSTTVARGVVDAVYLDGELNGVLFASGSETSTMTDPVACEFVKTLHAFAGLLQEYGIVRVGTLGSYCYRCCCAWSAENYCRGPDDPEPVCDAYSNHSFGRALDVRYLYRADGSTYDINSDTDWQMWTAAGETCTTALAAQAGTSRMLYELACEASARQIFSVILTPNYNDAHRNHWHMDIGQSGTPTSSFTRSFGHARVDLAEHGDE